MPSSDLSTRRQLREAALAGAGKKAVDPVLLDLRKLGAFSLYFYICHGRNRQQMQVIADAVEERLETKFRLRPSHREGGEAAEWIVLDYLDFMVHVFSPESRRFYDLERLWAKAPHLKLPAGMEAEPKAM